MDDLHCKINPLNVVVVATIPIALFSGNVSCRPPFFTVIEIFYGLGSKVLMR